jgi:hypothetical protein
MRRIDCLFCKRNGHPAGHRPHDGQPDATPAGGPDKFTARAGPHEQQPPGDWEALWIDLGGEG